MPVTFNNSVIKHTIKTCLSLLIHKLEIWQQFDNEFEMLINI